MAISFDCSNYCAQLELLRQVLVSQGQTGSHPSSKEMPPPGSATRTFLGISDLLLFCRILSILHCTGLVSSVLAVLSNFPQALFALGRLRWQRASESTAPPPLIIAACYMTMRE